MISIIVSSVNADLNRSFRQNVEDTIGVDYELLVHDNIRTGWGLSRLYNHYASASKYDILCFFHEDIIFRTQDWGKIIVDFLSAHPRAGVVGFAGSAVKTEYPTGWESHITAARQNLIQHFRDGNVKLISRNPDGDDFSPVAILDGLALITTKSVWSENPFDETTFNRFHLYDLDFTMQAAQRHVNYVCHTINVEHLSTGSYNEDWADATEKFINKWRGILPYRLPGYPESLVGRCRQVDSYKIVRTRLMNGNTGAKSLSYNIGKVCGLKYKLKIMKYIMKAEIYRFSSNFAVLRNKIRYA